MVAPRTLQLGKDQIFPSKKFDAWIAKGREHDNEPINGSVITCVIAFFFIYVGDINFVAQIISMFFMVTYGAICLISFLEHFSGDPSTGQLSNLVVHISVRSRTLYGLCLR